MGPVGVFDLVQLGLREGVVEVLDGHLVERDHVLKLIQLRSNTKEQKERERGKNNKVMNTDFLKKSMRCFIK